MADNFFRRGGMRSMPLPIEVAEFKDYLFKQHDAGHEDVLERMMRLEAKGYTFAVFDIGNQFRMSVRLPASRRGKRK